MSEQFRVNSKWSAGYVGPAGLGKLERTVALPRVPQPKTGGSFLDSTLLTPFCSPVLSVPGFIF